MANYLSQVNFLIKKHNVPYICKSTTPADGNCFFHAIVDQCNRPEIYQKLDCNILPYCQSHISLRTAIVNYMQEKKHTIENFDILQKFALEDSNFKKMSDYLQYMGQVGTWADTLTIHATSCFLRRNICLLLNTAPIGNPWQTFSSELCNSNFVPLTIAHINREHFQSIHPVPSSNDSTSSKTSATNVTKVIAHSSPTDKELPLPTSVCPSCKKPFKFLNMHLSKSTHCRENHGFKDLKSLTIFKKIDAKKKYAARNRDIILEKHRKYNKTNLANHAIYNKQHALQIKDKQTLYNRQHSEKIRNKQKQYNNLHSTKIRNRQEQYNKLHSDKIRNKQEQYNKLHSMEIKEKQALYNINNSEVIKLKQSEYNRRNAKNIRDKQEMYNKVNANKIKKAQESYNTANKISIKAKQARYNRKNAEVISLKQILRRHIFFDSIGEQQRYKKFKDCIKEGLSYTCTCCQRLFFKSQVFSCGSLFILKTSVEKLSPNLFKEAFSSENRNLQKDCKTYLCRTCHKYLFKKKDIPPQSVTNGLYLDHIPKKLLLNELENTLIAKNIIFLKLFCLPVSRWSAITDRVINVPITDNDLEKTLSSFSSLPRKLSDAGIIPVQLKRKLSYKNFVSQAFIHPEKLQMAIKYLQKKGHPAYTNVCINKNYNAVEVEDATGSESDENMSTTSNSDSDDCEDGSTMMIDDHPDMRIINNSTDHYINSKQMKSSKVGCSIAPGEGKIPINLLRDIDWDIKAFPMLFPSGKYGLDFPRTKKLSPQQYFNQRLLNRDNRFSSNTPFIFSSVYYVERYQLEQQINISYRKGQFKDNNFFAIEDGFSVFDKIPGTPRYWQQKRYEMIARLEQLGPFQLFFTLSMADKRWEENYISVLSQKGCKISFIPNIQSKKNSFESEQVLVNDVPLEEYLANENKTELFRNNVLSLTRNFDQRVRAFIKNIVCGPNSPMHVQYYTFRVEFQVRGAAHVHGALWLDLQALDNTFPGLKMSMQKLQSGQTLSEKEEDTVINFIDNFISVSSDTNLKEIVKEVQTHHHTKTCRKRSSSSCRFSYPRFPSEKTIIAKPLRREDFLSEESFKEKIKMHELIMQKVTKTLNSLGKDDLLKQSLSMVLLKAGISKKEYYEALQVSSKGLKVILKRSVADIFINNYNQEWLRAWNGNMDIQMCLDHFAIATYITDYYTKDESGTTKFLKEAGKQSFSSLKEKMACLAHVFLSHRQMGLSEAFYRILPSLHLSESNIKCKFVHTGFPENRSKFLRKVHKVE